MLYSKVIEVSERVTLEAWTESRQPVAADLTLDTSLVEGVTGEIVRVLEPLGNSKKHFLLLSIRETYNWSI